nr:immunoglobulin heavy chain junction region [Macaca mulatta]
CARHECTSTTCPRGYGLDSW